MFSHLKKSRGIALSIAPEEAHREPCQAQSGHTLVGEVISKDLADAHEGLMRAVCVCKLSAWSAQGLPWGGSFSILNVVHPALFLVPRVW